MNCNGCPYIFCNRKECAFEKSEGQMTDKRVIFESEEELLNFMNDCIYGKTTENTMILAKRHGYIRKNPVEEAEEIYKSWHIKWGVSDLSELCNKQHEAIQYLKHQILELKK